MNTNIFIRHTCPAAEAKENGLDLGKHWKKDLIEVIKNTEMTPTLQL